MSSKVQGSEFARSCASINLSLVSAYYQTVSHLIQNTRNHPQSIIHICPFHCIGFYLRDCDETKHRNFLSVPDLQRFIHSSIPCFCIRWRAFLPTNSPWNR